MIIRILNDRSIIKDSDPYGTQNENRVTTLNFVIPEEYANFNKKIVFITSDGVYWDLITDNTYIVKNNLTKYRTVSAYVWLTDVESQVDFRTKIFYIDFNQNTNPDNYIPSEEQIDGFDTMMEELREALDEVEGLTDIVRHAIVQTLPTTDIDSDILYFVPKQNPQTNNAYDKYMYVNNAWEKMDTSGADIGAVTSLQEVVGVDTDTFSTSSTYAVGDRVIYSKKWYECTTAVTVAGAWDSTKWTALKVIDELEDKVTNTDYATSSTGGVIKTSVNYATTMGDGILGAINKSYSDYGSMWNNAFISKGTLENVITGKGLVSNTDYATGSVGGVVKVTSDFGIYIDNGIIKGSTKTYESYTSGSNNLIISKATLENVLNARIGDINDLLDTINGEVI